MIDAAKVYTKALHAAGRSRIDEPEPFTDDELAQFGPGGIVRILLSAFFTGRHVDMRSSQFARYMGSTTLCRGERGKSLGWKPVLGTDAFLASLDKDVQALVVAA